MVLRMWAGIGGYMLEGLMLGEHFRDTSSRFMIKF